MKMDGVNMKNLVVQVFFDKSLITGHETFVDDGTRGSMLSAKNLEKDFYQHSQILAKEYAEKCGADYILFDEPYINFFNPTQERFRLIEEDKWAEEYDNILYLDCDAFVYKDCPNLFDLYPQENLRVVRDMNPAIPHEEKKTLSECGIGKIRRSYFNAGVLLFHKSSLTALKPLIKYRERFDEFPYGDQSELNYCVLKYDVPHTVMDLAYNSFGPDAKIAHLYGPQKITNKYHLDKAKEQAEGKMEGYLPDHLGGQVRGNVDVPLMRYVKEKFGIESIVDIGCGDGTAVKTYAKELDLEFYGVDGDWTRLPKTEEFILHDFSEDKIEFDPDDVTFDCAYSVEFLEHVDEECQENYMDLFGRCNYAVVTAAPPGCPGRHHVNCRTREYWIDVFGKYGFDFLEEETLEAKKVSHNVCNKGGEKNQYFKETGMIFKKNA